MTDSSSNTRTNLDLSEFFRLALVVAFGALPPVVLWASGPQDRGAADVWRLSPSASLEAFKNSQNLSVQDRFNPIREGPRSYQERVAAEWFAPLHRTPCLACLPLMLAG